MKIPERLLLGPGPSPVSARVMRAMSHPALSHLDPAMMSLLEQAWVALQSLFAQDDVDQKQKEVALRTALGAGRTRILPPAGPTLDRRAAEV